MSKQKQRSRKVLEQALFEGDEEEDDDDEEEDDSESYTGTDDEKEDNTNGNKKAHSPKRKRSQGNKSGDANDNTTDDKKENENKKVGSKRSGAKTRGSAEMITPIKIDGFQYNDNNENNNNKNKNKKNNNNNRDTKENSDDNDDEDDGGISPLEEIEDGNLNRGGGVGGDNRGKLRQAPPKNIYGDGNDTPMSARSVVVREDEDDESDFEIETRDNINNEDGSLVYCAFFQTVCVTLCLCVCVCVCGESEVCKEYKHRKIAAKCD